MDREEDGQTDARWSDEQINRQKVGRTERWKDRKKVEQTNGWTDR
jgi:hypothetical protein